MNKMIVTVFNSDTSAYEGVKALAQLHAEGSLTLYATAVIAKDAKGVVSVKQAADEGASGTAVGLDHRQSDWSAGRSCRADSGSLDRHHRGLTV